MPASGPPPWGPDDTGAVPVGPEPEPTGAAGGGTGSGGWGGKPKVEPFAIAALVWALVSIVLPLVGTIVALVLAARAADAIRRSRGTRSGTEMVTAARIIAGGVIALWAIGLVAFVALGGNDDDGNKVAVPTQPPVTSTTLVPATTVTTQPPTTTVAPSTTTSSLPKPSVIVDPTQPPTTQPPPTQPPPTTQAPTTAPPTTAPPTTTTTPPPTTTTSPQQAITAKIERNIGPSNRNVPADERVVVDYSPGTTLVVTWAINNGPGTLPTGQPTCAPPPTSTTTTTSTTTPGATTTSSTTTTTTTTTTTPGATTTTLPQNEGTRTQARKEARLILQTVRAAKLDITGVQLIGTYPIEGPGTSDVDVVQVFYSKADLDAGLPIQAKVFVAPPATTVQCLNPAFD